MDILVEINCQWILIASGHFFRPKKCPGGVGVKTFWKIGMSVDINFEWSLSAYTNLSSLIRRKSETVAREVEKSKLLIYRRRDTSWCERVHRCKEHLLHVRRTPTFAAVLNFQRSYVEESPSFFFGQDFSSSWERRNRLHDWSRKYLRPHMCYGYKKFIFCYPTMCTFRNAVHLGMWH